MRVSSDRGRAGAAAVKPAAQPAAEKPAAPRPAAVQVPTPRAAARAPQAADSRQASPPWEDIPPDDYVPLSADEMFGGPPGDGFVPVFDSGPDDVRVTPRPAETRPSAPVDTRPLPPAIALDPVGFDGEWPALAARLPLKGVAYQLAFNSELTAVDATTLKLSVPVPQYADAAQVAKLKAALADALGKPVEVAVEVRPHGVRRRRSMRPRAHASARPSRRFTAIRSSSSSCAISVRASSRVRCARSPTRRRTGRRRRCIEPSASRQAQSRPHWPARAACRFHTIKKEYSHVESNLAGLMKQAQQCRKT